MRKYEEITITNLESLIPEVPLIRGVQQGNYYRGHADGDWEIQPSLFRLQLEDTECESWLELANSRILKFKQLAPADVASQLSSELEWTATASHHHAPTQFSAWTEAALVALYFATQETPNQCDGAMWRMMPGADELTIYHDFEVIPDAPRFFHPRYRTEEMTAQRVCFLTHPIPEANLPPVSFENFYNASTEPCNLCKVVIPHEAKAELRKQIAALGVDARTVFPGLKGIGRQIGEEVYACTQSYNWMM